MKIHTALFISNISISVSAIQSQLVGTWASKSAATLTGASFYNPIKDAFIEPTHTGISYSFTADGFYEEAHYRAVPDPTKPSCPKAILQFQHGKFSENPDGSLTLTPFSVDGRKLESDPCSSKHALYTRYNQTEIMKKYQVYIDSYMKITRLDLYQFDGTKLPPMYLAFTPPQMLPTVTLNPISATTVSVKTIKHNTKRENGWTDTEIPLNKRVKNLHNGVSIAQLVDPITVWWSGVGLILLGGAVYLI